MSKSVFSKEEADQVAITFHPKKFPNVISPVASEFMAYQANQKGAAGASFRIDRIVADQTGVAELERLSMEEKVEIEALNRLKSVQEEAYQQAYAVGAEEGRESAFNEFRGQFEERLQDLDRLLSMIGNLKKELVTYNEAHIVGLIYHLAKRVALSEIEKHPEFILGVVSQAIESAQADEDITVRLSKLDMDFIESVRPKLGKEFESLKKIKLEVADEVSPGGCVVRTNYGEVDATVEQRVNKLWKAIAEKVPRSQDSAGE